MDSQQISHGDGSGEGDVRTLAESVQPPAAPNIQPEEAIEIEDDSEERIYAYGDTDESQDDGLEDQVGTLFYVFPDKEGDEDDDVPLFGFADEDKEDCLKDSMHVEVGSSDSKDGG